MMKRICIVVMIILILTLTACQPTPEEPVISQKDNLEDLIQNTAAPKDSGETQTTNITETENSDEPQPTETEEPVEKYQETIEFEDSVFKVVIDAVIDKTDGPIPLAMVEPYLFTQEDAQRALDVFFGDQTLYDFNLEDYFTKEIHSKEIFTCKTILATIKNDSSLDTVLKDALIDSYNEWIAALERLEARYSVEKIEWNEFIPELVVDGERLTIDAKVDTGKSCPTDFSIGIQSDKINCVMSYGNDGTVFAYQDLYSIADDIPGMNTTYEEALTNAEDLLKSLEINNMTIQSAQIGTIGYFRNENIIKEYIDCKYIPKSYQFIFSPEIEGLKN